MGRIVWRYDSTSPPRSFPSDTFYNGGIADACRGWLGRLKEMGSFKGDSRPPSALCCHREMQAPCCQILQSCKRTGNFWILFPVPHFLPATALYVDGQPPQGEGSSSPPTHSWTLSSLISVSPLYRNCFWLRSPVTSWRLNSVGTSWSHRP